MNVQQDPASFDLDDFLARQERKSLLRFIVCGSVDHGKSTVIGRLLYEAGMLFADQIVALDHDSRRHGTLGDERDYALILDGLAAERDYALILDGLAAEREQKITIDLAYRFFTTVRRKFIVADAPGHEHYTRNMATGASIADLAVLLVSASEGLTRQTRRHLQIVSTLGVRHIVVAVNKMDLADWSELRFTAIEAEVRAFTSALDVHDIVFIPVAGRSGDNIANRSQRMRWYRGPVLLQYLEQVQIAPRRQRFAFRMPVQWVCRPGPEFRGYCGLVASGEVYPGMAVQVLPSGQRTLIKRIVTADGDLAFAFAGQSVTLTFADEIDASRGDVVAEIGPPAPVTNRLCARLVWIGTDALVPGRTYLLKLAAATVKATIEPGLQVVDLHTHNCVPAERLVANDIGTAVIGLDRGISADRYVDTTDTGSFILIDPESFETVCMGVVEAVHPGERRTPTPRTRTLHDLMRTTETHARSVAKAVSWRATGSLDTFIVAIAITGSSKLAGGVALAEVVTKTGLYYLHERIWASVPWGKQ